MAADLEIQKNKLHVNTANQQRIIWRSRISMQKHKNMHWFSSLVGLSGKKKKKSKNKQLSTTSSLKQPMLWQYKSTKVKINSFDSCTETHLK